MSSKVYKRDGYNCPFTGYSFKPPGPHVDPRCAHILPFSFHDKVCRRQILWCSSFSKLCQHLTFKAVETFTGGAITANVARDKINHPSNAFNAQTDAHDSFDKLAWGIEALEQPGGEVSHIVFYRFYPLNCLTSTNTSSVWSAIRLQLQCASRMETKFLFARGTMVRSLMHQTHCFAT